jgi:hypothetical protein
VFFRRHFGDVTKLVVVVDHAIIRYGNIHSKQPKSTFLPSLLWAFTQRPDVQVCIAGFCALMSVDVYISVLCYQAFVASLLQEWANGFNIPVVATGNGNAKHYYSNVARGNKMIVAEAQ